ncbi:MAG: asparagine synthetase B [Dehalococcoidia bacterium]|nr:asparagine synthetase B [Dehalococcoidia bacterium]
MSPVCGAFNRINEDVTVDINSMMHALNHKSAAQTWLLSEGVAKEWQGGDEPAKGPVLGQVSFSVREQPIERPSFDCIGNLAVLFEGELYNSQALEAKLDPGHKLSNGSASEIVAHMLEEVYEDNLAGAVKKVVRLLDGPYCIAVSNGAEIILVRDPAGLRPVFYAENGDLQAFASRKTALWHIGLRNVKPLRAGMLASFSKNGIRLDEAYTLEDLGSEVVIDDLDTTVDSYCNLLISAIEKRMQNLKRFGVLMSGGVDSCLIAKLASEAAAEEGVEVTAYTAGTYGAADFEHAEHFARELGLKHRVRRLSQSEVESYVPSVVAAVEERDIVQIEAGIGIYAALEMASQDGVNAIFSGQGPDELWGGYTWYPQLIARGSYEKLLQTMQDDLARGDIETFDRENKVALAHGVEQLFPYVDNEIVKLAMSVSPRLKVTSGKDTMGKHPHRQAARRLGLPAKYACRGKNAAQHGTGIHDALDTVARKKGFTPRMVARIGYNSEEVSKEKLASSTRYGYKYDDEELWQVSQHVQLFLDSIAYDNGLLNNAERSKIEEFLQKA